MALTTLQTPGGIFWFAEVSSHIAAVLKRMSASMVGLHADQGNIVAVNKKLVATFNGTQLQTGSEVATLKKLQATLSGQKQYLGTMTALFPGLLVPALIGEQAQAGTLSASELKLVASLMGEMEPQGTIAAQILKPLANLAGAEAPNGDMASQMLALTSLMAGIPIESGSVSALFLPPTASFNAIETQQGAMSGSLKKLNADAAGSQQQTGILAGMLKQLNGDIVGAEQPKGSISAALKLASAAMTSSQTQSGTIVAALNKASSLLSAGQIQQGSLAASLKKALATLAGNIVALASPIVSGVNFSTTTTVTIPAHSPGQTIVIVAYRNNSNSQPSKPSSTGTIPAWNDVPNCNNAGANTNAARVCSFVATASNHTSGTWSGATDMMAIVLSGTNAFNLGGSNSVNASATNSAVAPAIGMWNNDGTSTVLEIFCDRNVSAWGSAPSGFTRQAAQGRFCVNTQNDTTLLNPGCSQPNTSSSGGYIGITLEILPLVMSGPYFDSGLSFSSAGPATATGTLIPNTTGTAVIIVDTYNNHRSTPTSVTLGGSAMTNVSDVDYANEFFNSEPVNHSRYIKTVNVTAGVGINVTINLSGTVDLILGYAACYMGVGSVGATVSQGRQGPGTALSQTVACGAGQRIVQGFGMVTNVSFGNSLSNASGGAMHFWGSPNGYGAITFTDTNYVGNTTYTATATDDSYWEGVYTVLNT